MRTFDFYEKSEKVFFEILKLLFWRREGGKGKEMKEERQQRRKKDKSEEQEVGREGERKRKGE